MPGTFYGIGFTSRALRAFQSALDITGHNIANANTPGYTRQVANFGNVEGVRQFGLNPYMLGAGTDITSVSRARDRFLEMRYTSNQGELGRNSELLASLKNIETVMNEPGTNGISSALGKYFDSWSALASNPGEGALRGAVQAAGATLTSRIRGLAKELNSQSSDNAAQIANSLDRIDQLTAGIAEMNSQIRIISSGGGIPNDLLDQRDAMVTELGSMMDLTTTDNQDGTVILSVSGYMLVDYSGSRPIPRTYDAAAQTLTDPTANLTISITTGKLAGQFQASTKATAMLADLDKFTTNLRDTVNTMHQAGTNSLGTTGIDFFKGNGAYDIDLSAEVKADARNISSGASGRESDGGLALSLANLRDTKIVGLGDMSFRNFYGSMVSGLGRDVSVSQASFDTQLAVAKQIQGQIESISGVNLDEEMANMMKFQRSYQAAAKTLSILDQVTEDLIGMIR